MDCDYLKEVFTKVLRIGILGDLIDVIDKVIGSIYVIDNERIRLATNALA